MKTKLALTLLMSTVIFSTQANFSTTELYAWANQEGILTTLCHTELQFEKALSYGYQPTAADLFLVIKVEPTNTKLIRTLVDDYGVAPEFIDQNGNNALHLIPLCPETVQTICYLMRSNVRTAYANNAGVSFMDRLAAADFEGKEEIEECIITRDLPYSWPVHNDSDNSYETSVIDIDNNTPVQNNSTNTDGPSKDLVSEKNTLNDLNDNSEQASEVDVHHENTSVQNDHDANPEAASLDHSNNSYEIPSWLFEDCSCGCMY